MWVFWSPGVLGLPTRFPGGNVSGISFVRFVLLMWFCVCFSSPRDKNVFQTKKMSPFGISRQKVYYCIIVYTPKLEFHVLIANRTDKSFLGLKKRKPRRLQALPSSVFILTTSWMVCLRTCSKLQLFNKVAQDTTGQKSNKCLYFMCLDLKPCDFHFCSNNDKPREESRSK